MENHIQDILSRSIGKCPEVLVYCKYFIKKEGNRDFCVLRKAPPVFGFCTKNDRGEEKGGISKC